MRPNPKIRAVDPDASAPVSTVAEVTPAPETSAPVGSVTAGRWVRLANRCAPTLAFIFVLAIWELGCRVFRVPTFLLPPPSLIVRGAFEQSASIWAGHVWATVRVAVMGYVAAIAISIPMAIALASSRALSRTLYPLIVVVHSMPIVAVAPIIVVTLGASDLPRVVITFLIAFFPIVVTTTTGLLATPEEMIELSRSLRAGRTREMLHIRLPFALPYIFSALKIATTLSVVGAVVAEFVAAERGLGYFIQFSTSFFKINQGFAALVILVTISLGFFQVIGLAQRFFAPWSLPKSER
jgi:NitT/TauT family transport system permease protein